MKHQHLTRALLTALAFALAPPLLAQDQRESMDQPLLGPAPADSEGAGAEGGSAEPIDRMSPMAPSGGAMAGGMMCPMMSGMMGGGQGMKGGMMGGDAHAGLVSMLGGLDLSDEQWARVNKIRDDLRRQNWPLKGKLLDERSALRDLFAADKRDPQAIGKVYGRIFDLREQMIVHRVAAGNAIENVLTAAQREQLKQMRRARATGGMMGGARQGRAMRGGPHAGSSATAPSAGQAQDHKDRPGH